MLLDEVVKRKIIEGMVKRNSVCVVAMRSDDKKKFNFGYHLNCLLRFCNNWRRRATSGRSHTHLIILISFFFSCQLIFVGSVAVNSLVYAWIEREMKTMKLKRVGYINIKTKYFFQRSPLTDVSLPKEKRGVFPPNCVNSNIGRFFSAIKWSKKVVGNWEWLEK